MRVAGLYRCIAVVDDPQFVERVDTKLKVVHLRLAVVAREPDLTRPETSSGTISDEVVHRRPDEDHISARQAGGIEKEWNLLKGGSTRV
jgi:hypothetical protein